MFQALLPGAEARCNKDIYPRIYHPSFRGYLECITSDAHETSTKTLLFVSVHVDPDLVFGSSEAYPEHYEYLREQFACINRMSGIKFEVSVHKFEDLPDFRKHGEKINSIFTL